MILLEIVLDLDGDVCFNLFYFAFHLNVECCAGVDVDASTSADFDGIYTCILLIIASISTSYTYTLPYLINGDPP